MSNTKHQVLLLTALAVILNFGLLLLPSVLLGVPHLVWHDRRLAAFLLMVSIWIMLEAAASSKRIHVNNPNSSGQWLPTLMSAAMLCVFLTSLTEQALLESKPFTILATIGYVVMAGGVVLRYIAIRALGSYFLDEVVVVSGQSLVTTGIYNRVRHPSETGNLCIAFGSSLLLGSLIGSLTSTLVVLPIVLVRIRLEDKLLMHHYPSLFATYARDVPALFPWLPRRG